MFGKLLLVLGISFGYGSNLTLTPNNSVRYDFIDYESPNYRLGDYDITTLEHISSGGGQVRFNRIQAIIPRVVFNTLGQYENVFISMPLYDYNSAVDLYMRIDFYVDGVLDYPVIYDMETIPLSMTMLKTLPYTMVDSVYHFNVFDPYYWEYDYGQEVRLTFVVPYTPHTNPPSDYAEQLKNITLFTKRADGYAGGYDNGYDDGYYDGYYDGVNDGYYDGVNDGYDDGYYDGFIDGTDEGYIGGYTDGLQDGYIDGTDEGYIGGYTDGLQDGYEIGFSDAETIGDGTWLGNLVFGTIGGIVGFLFALSDFEVLGVSIMSIITLFVAIGIVKLLLKVLR